MRARRPAPTTVHAAGNAQAPVCRSFLAPSGGLGSALNTFGQATAFEFPAMDAGIARLNRVSKPQLAGVNTQLLCRHIEKRLKGESYLGVAKAAESAGRDLIGVNQVSFGPDVLEAIKRIRPYACLAHHQGAIVGVGAIIRYNPNLLGRKSAIPLYS